MTAPTVSVIIVTYNRPAALRQTLEDLRAQTVAPLEILVVDQSRDADGRPLDLSPLAAEFPNLRYLYQAVPNAQRARNLGIRRAKGDVVLLVDDDVRIGPGFVASHLRNYEDDPTLDGVSGQVLEPGQQPTTELPAACDWPHIGWMFLPLHYARRRPAVNWPSCNGSVRREMALKAGGFDEQFVRTWLDDTDFSWRLHQAGAKIVFDPLASLVHLKVPSGGKRPARVNRHVLADTEHWGTLFYFWRKNFGMRRAWRHYRRYVRRLICRKVLLARPHWLGVALWHMAAGYRWAGVRVRQGGIYLKPEEPVRAAAQAEASAAV